MNELDKQAWGSRADELAEWAWTRLVNRTDAWGGYCEAGTITRPAKATRGKVELLPESLARHFHGKHAFHIIGLHSGSIGPDSTARWIAADIDAHGEVSDAIAERNTAAALYWFDTAQRLGFTPLLTDSNGKGGFHLRILFATPIPLSLAYCFSRWFFRDAAERGLPDLEIFPKQPALASPGHDGQYGNWLRVPGRHHKRDHWTRCWNGIAWLAGNSAIEKFLAIGGDDPAIIPQEVLNWKDHKSDPAPVVPRTVFVIPGMTTAYAAAALRNETQRVATAPIQTRNIALNKAAFALGRFVGSGELDRVRVEAALANAARRVGLNDAEIPRTIQSGINSGMMQPRGG